MRRYGSLVVCCLVSFLAPASALNIVPGRVGDPHFTSGPCPMIVPLDGAACANGAATCPAFYNPAILPAGYNSVQYCAQIPAGIGYNSPGYTYLTMPLNPQEQQAFLAAAKRVETYVKDPVTVTMEVYKVAYLCSFCVGEPNYLFFGGNEYWNPVCGVDALFPPFTNRPPTVLQNPDGSYGYQGIPETYSPVLFALKAKNLRNSTPMKLINYLPSYSHINVEWPSYMYAWQADTGLDAYDVTTDFLFGTSGFYTVSTSLKPLTLCGSPATMKMLGLAPAFNRSGHTINEINSPQYNMNVTLSGTDGALVIPDITNYPPPYSPPYTWFYNPNDPSIVNTQLPKAYYEKTFNYDLPQNSCSDPTQCIFPLGFNGGHDLVGVFNHEINHVLGTMQSQYYKLGGETTVTPYTYGNALFLLELFDIDSDYVVPGYGSPGIQSYSDFTSVPRNATTFSSPQTITHANSPSALTPFVQFGQHDHVMVYDVTRTGPQYFPLMNASVGNPDGDIQFQRGYVQLSPDVERVAFVDPLLTNMSEMNVVHMNVQAGLLLGTIDVDTVREYSELAAQGWNIDYSTLKPAYSTKSPVAKWYQTCFDANGVFTTAKNSKCKFSVLPADLKFLQNTW